MRLYFQKTLPFLLAILLTAQATVAQDSMIAQTMKSVIFIPFRGGNANRNKPRYYINGSPVPLDKVKAACMTYQPAALAFARFDKWTSHPNRPLRVFLIGEAMALALTPLFTQPAVYKNNNWQTAELTLVLASFSYYLGWGIIAEAKLKHAVRLYNRSLFIRAGIPTPHTKHRIKFYYGRVFRVF